jgi:hypothetical protein
MWPASFLELFAAVVLAAALALTVDAGADVLEACAATPDPLPVAPVAAGEPDVGVSEPLISAWTVELKVPVMPLRLFEPLNEELE